ncbi:MAG: FkbM family methyltransferase [Methanoregula sp.]|jgi:FkbM family methyltransferase
MKFHNRKNGREFIVEVNNRYKMYLNLNDKGISLDLAIYKTREVFTTDYFQKIITEDMIIIDIGANIGYYVLLESQLASRGNVYAIEPVPENYNLLNKNIALNHCTNVSTYNFGISNVNGFSEMYVYDKYNWSSFIQNPWGNIIDIIQVPVFTLDKFIESHVTDNPLFIRMDVEGFEYEVLKGSSKTLQTVRPLIICIEMHPHLMSRDKVSECIKLMKDNQFTIKAIFVEIGSPSDLKFTNFFYKLNAILNLPQYGYYGNDFSSLEELLNYGHEPMVFFEKTTGALCSVF